MIRTIKNKIRVWSEFLRAVGELSRMTDAQLADIGISRCDIERVVRSSR